MEMLDWNNDASDAAGESTVFIEFMLSIIIASLIDVISTRDAMSDETMDKEALRRTQIEKYLKTHPFIMNADARLQKIMSAVGPGGAPRRKLR